MIQGALKAALFVMLISPLSCNKIDDQPLPEEYFIAANIDGSQWKKTGRGIARFSAEYNNTKRRFRIDIHANIDEPRPLAKGVSFNFDFVPKPGRYYFNNNASTQSNSGSIATYTYYNVNRVDAKWSTSGYIDIESITIGEAKGSFTFTAKGDVTNPEITTISNGSFNVIYGGSSGAIWPGP